MSDEPRRMRLTGLHHLTAICTDAGRTVAFYRDVLGLRVVHDGHSDDDASARHVWLSAGDGGAGSLISFLEYPQLPQGTVGRGTVQHFAFIVETAEELDAWHAYLRGRGLEVTDVLARSGFRSVYVRDPDYNLVEIATRGPGFEPGPVELGGPPA